MVPYLRVANVLDGYIDYSDVYAMHFSQVEQAKYTLRPGDVLLNEGQSTELVGRSALYEGPESRYCFQNSLVNFRAGPSVHPRFARAIFKRWLDIGHFTKVLKQTTSMAHLGGERFANLEFPVPPLPEQRQIAAILDTVDDAIRKTELVIAKLKQVKQGLLHDLLTRGIDENGELRDPLRHSEQFKVSPLGRIPREWDVSPLHRLADLQVGYAFKSEWFSETEGVRLLRGENVGYGAPDWGLTKLLPERYSDRYGEYLLSPGDVIIGMDRTFTKTGVKVSVLTEEDTPALLVQRVGRFIPLQGIGGFVLQLLRWPAFHLKLLAQQKGMDIPHLSKTEILSPVVAVPLPEEQGRIADALGLVDERQATEQKQLKKLRALKQGMAEDLLTGVVRATNLSSKAKDA